MRLYVGDTKTNHLFSLLQALGLFSNNNKKRHPVPAFKFLTSRTQSIMMVYVFLLVIDGCRNLSLTSRTVIRV